MTSSMLTGDRRWASSKRGGMTVLGKVTVPKPINLPSQRLENHGLDPNVEIVPRGTLSWGSRSSSATNAWGSSSLSPHADGGISSPSHLSGRPSSGGSGTRPSTAGSDRAHENSANARDPNSRPSSASGPPTANHTSLTSLRPHSAETRPGSSQLSRFAEPTTENLGGWTSAAIAEKLGGSQPKQEEFSLTSGDFPTLGSDKDKSERSTESQDLTSHGRPGSSSGHPKKKAGDIPTYIDMKGEPGHFWRRDNPPYSEDGLRPGVDKWQGNPLPYPNAHIPPHYEPWRAPPVNNPQGGVWFRGPPGGPPFGGSIPTNGFPVEPFTYYRPHLPPAVLSNVPPVPPPVAGPRGHHPKSGDVYRPQIPDPYIRPGMPMRPGFYPGPVAYEGYYGPSMGYCSSNERDVPFMGMVKGPSVYNSYSSQNPPEPVNLHGMPGGYNSSGDGLISDQMETNHHQDSGGPCKVLMLQHNDWDGKNDRQQWVDTITSNVHCGAKGDQQGMTARDAEHRSDERKNENRESGSLLLKAKSLESIGSHNALADTTALKLADSASATDATLELSSAPRDPSLMQKIKGLNAKARDSSSAKIRVEGNKFPSANAKPILLENESNNENSSANQTSNNAGAFNGDKNQESLPATGTSTIRRSTHGMQGKNDHHIKGILNSQDVDGWQRKTLGIVSSVSSAVKSNSIRAVDSHASVSVIEKPGPYNHGRDDGGSGQILCETSDVDMQRAKMKESVKQRTKQLQEEEEERTRRQRAKALAKLEELNRRTQAVDGSSPKLEESMEIQDKQGESSGSDLTPISSKLMAENSAIVRVPDVSQSAEVSSSKVEISSVLTSDGIIDTRKSAAKEFVAMHKDSTPLDHFVDNSNVSHHDNAPQVHSNIASKHRGVGHRHKQNIPFEKRSTERFVSNQEIIPKVETGTGVVVASAAVTKDNSLSCVSTPPVNTNPSVDLALHQKKKSNRNGKNKPKVEETSASFSTSFTSKEGLISSTAGITKLKTADIEPDRYSVLQSNSSKDALSEQRVSSSNEEYHLRASNQWKSQQSRRFPRNSQANRPVEKFNGSDSVIWAPVKSQSKTEIASESSNKDDVDVQEVFPAKNDDQNQSNSKNRRAEKEIYIPKPVAKEMAQQGSVQDLTANQTTADENGKSDSISRGTEGFEHLNPNVGKVGSSTEPRSANGRQNKHGKTQGSWRQRGATEPTIMHDLHDGSNFSMNSGVQRSNKNHQTLKYDESTVIEQSKNSNQRSESTDNRENFERITQNAIRTVKDQTVAIRERRHSLRGQKGVSVKHDIDHKANSWEVENSSVPHPSVEPNPAAVSASKENQSFSDRSTSHWRPKSPSLPSNNLRGRDIDGGQNVGAQIDLSNKKDATPHVDPLLLPPQDKQAYDVFQPRHVHYVSKRSNGGDTQNHEAPRDGKAASFGGLPSSPDQGSVSLVEQVPTRMDFRHEQWSSSGFRKNGNQSSRFSRGHESRVSQNLPLFESNPHKQPGNLERQGQNMHYEYQPVRPHNKNNSERSREVNQTGPRTRERGNQSRRGGGNFYGRQSSAIQVDAGYE